MLTLNVRFLISQNSISFGNEIHLKKVKKINALNFGIVPVSRPSIYFFLIEISV